MGCMAMTGIISNSPNRKFPRNHLIDLLIWDQPTSCPIDWKSGSVLNLSSDLQTASKAIDRWAENSQAEYGLFWSGIHDLPTQVVLMDLSTHELDLVHAGLRLGMGNIFQDLSLIFQDWSMINAPSDVPSSSWRVSFDACLIRRTLWLEMNGIDPAYTSLPAASLDFGLRSLRKGALIEYRPELIPSNRQAAPVPPALEDLYTFVLRHFGSRWVQYLFARRCLKNLQFSSEHRTVKYSRAACTANYRTPTAPVTHNLEIHSKHNLKKASVTVIIPTLGRYEYIPGALQSILQQSVRPMQPGVYEGYPGLNLQVIWQDETGQSLARNTGLKAARGEYVFLFDDDSTAFPDCIEQHLFPLLSGCYDVSTGVAFPPPSEQYELPENYRFPRLAQTLDTGNCLLKRELAYKLGGLDRNYDFGPGADADFGTRLYLAGCRVYHNPYAQRIHFKASSGGLRLHGAFKYNSDKGFFSAFPPVTRSYYAFRFLSSRQRREMAFLSFFLSKYPKEVRQPSSPLGMKFGALFSFLLSLIFFPLKFYLSQSKARKLLAQGPVLGQFSEQCSNPREK
jgi:glycosyltransferase involved in cell wall biosynthesis